ncbi:hypothetical protein TI05_09445 [Achromatium sp. WMS3]|nr:hypothetical protein TI05_09445 [Achromatium sp. WMS3]
MIQSIFVDTGAWYAVMVRKDRDHKAAKGFIQNNIQPLITSDYIMDETVTLLLSRVGYSYAIQFLDMLQISQKVQLVYLTPTQIAATATLFRERADKEWSFTDCSSFILMQEYRIQVAFAFDEHCKQAGFQVKP